MSTNAVSSKETYSNGKFVAGLFKFLKYAVLVFACLIVFIPLVAVSYTHLTLPTTPYV